MDSTKIINVSDFGASIEYDPDKLKLKPDAVWPTRRPNGDIDILEHVRWIPYTPAPVKTFQCTRGHTVEDTCPPTIMDLEEYGEPKRCMMCFAEFAREHFGTVKEI